MLTEAVVAVIIITWGGVSELEVKGRIYEKKSVLLVSCFNDKAGKL